MPLTPLSDEQVEGVLDFLGRTQPIGQKQLALATATGGGPLGGPVTGPPGTAIGGGLAGGGLAGGVPGRPRGVSGGASPLLQAGRVADLVLRAAGLIPSAPSFAGVPAVADTATGQALRSGAAESASDLIRRTPDFVLSPTGAFSDLPAATSAISAEAESAQLGAAGLGDIPSTGVPGGTGLGGAGLSGQVGAGLGLAGGVAGAVLAKDPLQRALSSTNAALFAASLVQPELLPIALAASVLTGGIGLLGGLFGQHTKGSAITLPGFSGPIQTRTAGGTQTLLRSFHEGQRALGPFVQAIQAARTPEELVAVLNQNPQPNRFNVGAWGAAGGPGGVPSNRTDEPSERRWTVADLANPEIVKNLTIQAGAMGAPANQPDLAEAVKQYIRQLTVAPAAPAAAPPAGRAPVGPRPERRASGALRGMRPPEGPAGALGFSRDVLEAA